MLMENLVAIEETSALYLIINGSRGKRTGVTGPSGRENTMPLLLSTIR